LDEEHKKVVLARRTCIEICLTSNLLCVFPFFALGSSPSVRSLSPLADAKRYSDSKITTSGITSLGTTPSPSVYVRYIIHAYALALFIPHDRLVLTHLVAPSQTDDILPFRNSMLGEYALLMAPEPFGLGLTENEVETIARMGMESRFPRGLP